MRFKAEPCSSPPQSQKCDTARPYCSTCIQTGKQCEYPAPIILKSELQGRAQQLQDKIYEATIAHINSGSAPCIGAVALETRPARPPALSQSVSMTYILVDLRNWQPGTEMPLRLRANLYV